MKTPESTGVSAYDLEVSAAMNDNSIRIQLTPEFTALINRISIEIENGNEEAANDLMEQLATGIRRHQHETLMRVSPEYAQFVATFGEPKDLGGAK